MRNSSIVQQTHRAWRGLQKSQRMERERVRERESVEYPSQHDYAYGDLRIIEELSPLPLGRALRAV